jgi:CarboxypepD_reg-like domain/TonB dependent receptor-like, beta-barrel
MKSTVLILLLLSFQLSAQENKTLLSGSVTSSKTSQPVKDANIIVENTSFGTTTDTSGFYSIKIPSGSYLVTFSCIGYESHRHIIKISQSIKNIKLDIILNPKVYETGEVSVKGDKTTKPISVQDIKEKDLVTMPNLYSDVIRGVKILPGVTSNNELTSAYNVRGGNFDENLIYLDGYEIYRPFLLQQGIEESQSIVNQNMVRDIRFYNGAFPVNFDDKMSSVLEINYKNNFDSSLNGNINFDLLNTGLTLNKRFGNLNISTGFRYANPALFANVLQTTGKYRPYFTDIQILSSYDFSESSGLELFFLKAYNKFDLTPDNWEGQFQLNRVDIRQVTLEYNGKQYYSFNRSIAGLKYFNQLSKKLGLDFSFAYYFNKEAENKNLSNNVYYSEDAYNPGNDRQYLKTAYDFSDNSLLVNTYEIKSGATYTSGNHIFRGGIKLKFSRMNNVLNESTYEIGPDTVLNAPYSAMLNQDVNFNSIAAFLEDNLSFSEALNANFGIRALKYYYNNQTLISPRINVNYNLNPGNKLSFGWGFYYQPPYYYELRDKDLSTIKPLLAQKAVHYVLSWENKFNPTSDILAEVYYKKLTDIIPYYIDQLKLIYSDQNNFDGYAFGVDLQYRGELVKGITSWIGYSYLDTKERNLTNNTGFKRRLLDQTHTIRIYLQDGAKRHKNFQSHVVFIFGSGFLFHPQKTITDPVTGLNTITTDYDRVGTFPFYFRVDMGLTFSFDIGESYKLIIIPEVYNIFNQYNIASYSWYHVLSETKQPVPIANIYSKRFFNIGVKLSF